MSCCLKPNASLCWSILPTLPNAEATLKTVKQAAPSLELELLFFNASTPAEIDAAFVAIARRRAEALFMGPGLAFLHKQRVRSTTAPLAATRPLPTSVFAGDVAKAGLLISYGTNVGDVFRQVGVYTGSILKGAKPADLPVLQSTKFEFIINLQAARSLGLDIPPTLLARADDVIE